MKTIDAKLLSYACGSILASGVFPPMQHSFIHVRTDSHIVAHFITFPSSLLIHVLVFSSDSAFMPNGLDSFSVFHLSNGAAARKTSGISSNHPSPLLSFIVGVQTVTWRSFRKVFSVTPLCIIHRFIYISQTVVSANISTFFSVDLLRDEGGTAIGCFSGCWSVSLFENHFRS